jgi:hypothetical protein
MAEPCWIVQKEIGDELPDGEVMENIGRNQLERSENPSVSRDGKVIKNE